VRNKMKDAEDVNQWEEDWDDSDQKHDFTRHLQGCVVFVKATDDDDGEGLESKLATLGATLAPTLTNHVTHVVFKGGADDAEQQLRRLYDRAGEVFPPAHIVSGAWVLASERIGRRAMERPYTCAKPPLTPAPPTNYAYCCSMTTAAATALLQLLLLLVRYAAATCALRLRYLYSASAVFLRYVYAALRKLRPRLQTPPSPPPTTPPPPSLLNTHSQYSNTTRE
jgi:hypothetical protein